MTGQALVSILFAFIAVVAAVMVVSLNNPVHSALALILNLMSIAVLYYTLNAPFLMAVQLIVYAGAIVVLFLFVVMLLTSRGEASGRNRMPWMRNAAYIGAALFLAGIVAVVKVSDPQNAMPGVPPVVGDPASIGRLLYKTYLLPFEATSILLLTALVGALYLGRHADKGAEDNYGYPEGENVD